jgi:hypothetical protein
MTNDPCHAGRPPPPYPVLSITGEHHRNLRMMPPLFVELLLKRRKDALCGLESGKVIL